MLIAGPTASGKSSLGLSLSERVGGQVVNTDSMQVYSDLHVLTARPSAADLKSAPHHLYGHVDGEALFSTGKWAGDVSDLIAQEPEANLIFVGGTGLYFKTLLEGLSPIPDVPSEIQKKWRMDTETAPTDELLEILKSQDPATASQLMPSDRQRIVRALEVFEATGTPLATWQAQPRQPLLDAGKAVSVFLDPDRERLYATINDRFDIMLDEGALNEVRVLRERGLPADRPVMRAHGVPHLIKYLAGDLSLDEASERSKADVRHYAKRQKTWFRNQMNGWPTLDPNDKNAVQTWLAAASQLVA